MENVADDQETNEDEELVTSSKDVRTTPFKVQCLIESVLQIIEQSSLE